MRTNILLLSLVQTVSCDADATCLQHSANGSRYEKIPSTNPFLNRICEWAGILLYLSAFMIEYRKARKTKAFYAILKVSTDSISRNPELSR